ncbi:MAG: hypothetical protein FWC03_11930 [Treponema sp.]|nr:hypothetical protein [Treponema sp.]
MKRFFTYLLIPAMYCFISCAPPIGNFESGGNGSGSAVDFWIIETVKRDYYINDNFNRDRDFYITSFEKGDEIQVYANEPGVTTAIKHNPDSDVSVSKGVTVSTYPFLEAGLYEVRVTYKEKTKTYRITVRGAEPPPGGSLDGLGGGIYWP